MGNNAKPSGTLSPSGAQYWFCALTFTHITPRWGLEYRSVWHCYPYFAPLVRFQSA
jgi:hypothetical protein